MSQPGWYPDPQGAGRRWWDGTTWTRHVQTAPQPAPQRPAPQQPQPAPPQPGTYGDGAVPASGPPQGPVLDMTVERRHVHADPQVIAYDGNSIALDQVEWVRYHVARTSMRGMFGFGKLHISDEWHFAVGRYPLNQAPAVAMVFTSYRKNTEHEAWTFLVNLSRRYLEPRLVAELTDRVRRGETIDIGAGVNVHQGGFTGGGVSLPWQSISGTQTSGGRVWIYQTGVSKPVLSVPQQNPNTVLIPELFTALTP